MSRSDRSKRFDLSSDAEPVPRPKIWVDGQQRPRFNATAYGATSLGMAKRDLAPAIIDAAQRLDQLGQSILRGERRVKVAWAGRAARLVPSYQSVGEWVLTLHAVLMDAHGLLVPHDTTDEEPAYPNLVRGLAEIDATPPVVLQPTRMEPTLHAIRSAIRMAPHDFGHETARTRDIAAIAEANPAAPRAKTGAYRAITRAIRAATCRVLLWIMLAFAVPVGAGRALMFHLDGGDLADWT